METHRVENVIRGDARKHLKDAIIKTRVHNDFSQTAFARYLRKNVVTVGRWERGETAPYPSAVEEMLQIAPNEVRWVFEDFIGKTRGQVFKEKFGNLAVREGPRIERWDKEPGKYCDEIAGVIHARTEQMLSGARSGDSEAAQSLLSSLKAILKEVDRLAKIRSNRTVRR